ncbi:MULTISPECIES: FeoA family protein [Aliagarivorans]|uniref:FeoA family protein n=1 Tax=Aliagarivorans TaxID=882379 RepID=UPI0003F4DCA2|nr:MULTISPECIES: FeoA family protein [Aliagarivorans]
MRLNQLTPGQRAQVLDLNLLSSAMRRKLLSVGVLPNTELQLIRTAPFGSPLQLKAKGISFALDLDQAKKIEVQAL